MTSEGSNVNIRPAIDVVAEQVAAYNDRDLERFLATYAPDAEVFGVAPEPLVGAAALREFYTRGFQDPSAHCRIETYVLFGERWVVARETISNARSATDTIATFEVRGEFITRASMLKADPISL